jgi:hypothetical protein
LYSLFGWAVAVSGDTAVVGALGENSDTNGIIDETVTFITHFRESGAAYVFAGLGPPPDSDGDGVADDLDQCPNTARGAVVDAHGCSAEQRDSDHDGVPDAHDKCPDTPGSPGYFIVDANGCSLEQILAQLAPCDGPWRNHGEYISALRNALLYAVAQEVLNEAQAAQILNAGVHSDCGKK